MPRAGVAAPFTRLATRDVGLAAVAVAWIGVGLTLDQGADLTAQRALGAATWLVLLALLRGERPAERAQVAVAVAVAAVGEYVLSPLLGLYDYRLDGVPSFVPPGHGLVYLAALALARSAPLARRRAPGRALALGTAGAWAAWGVLGAARPDALGAVLFLLLAAFLCAGRAPLVYAAAFALTAYLELLGTALGSWTWAAHAAGGALTAGNPPSGVAALYCVLDAIALAGGPAALRLTRRCRAASCASPWVAQPWRALWRARPTTHLPDSERRMRWTALVALLTLSLAAPVARAQTPARTTAAAELLDVMHMDRVIREAVSTTFEAQVRQNPLMAPYKETLEAFVAKYMTWEAMKPGLLKVYADAFTEVELRDMTAFYRTPTGQKLVAQQGELMRRGAEIGEQVAHAHNAELQAMIQARTVELAAERKP